MTLTTINKDNDLEKSCPNHVPADAVRHEAQVLPDLTMGVKGV